MAPSTIKWSEDSGIVTLTLDDPMQRVNTMNASFLASMTISLERLRGMGESLVGVIVTSAKDSFFAGGDLRELLAETDPARMTEFTRSMKSCLRQLETLSVPVVANVGGSALGGGLELALACHHRVALDAPHVRLGLPEVQFGLLPGGGGVVRTVRLLGLDIALHEVLLSGDTFDVKRAVSLGLVDELVASPEDLDAAARRWILEKPTVGQPWDIADDIPGGRANHASVERLLPGWAAELRSAYRGAPMKAAASILSAAVESTLVDVETAFEIETRYFVELVCGRSSKNLIQGTFFDKQSVKSGASRPRGPAPSTAQHIGVVGAGLMGTGIALTAARAGLVVTLADKDQDSAERGLHRIKKNLAKQVARGSLTEADAQCIASLITPVSSLEHVAEADVVIEAVFEDPALKANLLRRIGAVMRSDALLASNTSTLPISALSHATPDPSRFVGMHFFSPVERMELLEIVVGEATSDSTVARAFDLGVQLRKTPIVVQDGRGFFTSRVILQRLLESAAMIAEGISPVSVERASLAAGFPTGTLALIDDTSLSLPLQIYSQFREEGLRSGESWQEHPGAEVLRFLVEEADRPGRSAGAGFYEYTEGRRGELWDGLVKYRSSTGPHANLGDLVDRLLFADAVETARCLESGVLSSTADANVGSILGIGFPAWTGGAAQFVAGYEGGVSGFVARSLELAERHGERFSPPSSLLDAASAIT